MASLNEGHATAARAYKAKVASLTSELAELRARMQNMTEEAVKLKFDLRHSSTARVRAEGKEEKAREGLRVAEGELWEVRDGLQTAQNEVQVVREELQCDAPNPGCPLTTRQPRNTSGGRVTRRHFRKSGRVSFVRGALPKYKTCIHLHLPVPNSPIIAI